MRSCPADCTGEDQLQVALQSHRNRLNQPSGGRWQLT